MWERLSKLPVQIVIAFLIILLSFGLLYLIPFKEIPERNHDVFIALISGVIGSTVTPVIGWLYTLNKNNANGQKQNPS